MAHTRQRIKCFLCGKEMYLSNLPKHMMDIHGITITRDQIYEFDYVLRRFNQLREEIFGVDYITDLIDSSSENSLTNLSTTTSAMYCIQSISNHIISTEKVPIKTPEIVISQPQSLHSPKNEPSVIIYEEKPYLRSRKNDSLMFDFLT